MELGRSGAGLAVRLTAVITRVDLRFAPPFGRAARTSGQRPCVWSAIAPPRISAAAPRCEEATHAPRQPVGGHSQPSSPEVGERPDFFVLLQAALGWRPERRRRSFSHEERILFRPSARSSPSPPRARRRPSPRAGCRPSRPSSRAPPASTAATTDSPTARAASSGPSTTANAVRPTPSATSTVAASARHGGHVRVDKLLCTLSSQQHAARTTSRAPSPASRLGVSVPVAGIRRTP
jgi:hypothetical protein